MIFMKPNFWQTKNFVSLLLFPLTLITFSINFLKKFNIKNHFKIKTICIGNLSAGGTGKTSLAVELNKLLSTKFKTVFIKKKYSNQKDEYNFLKKRGKIISSENIINDLDKFKLNVVKHSRKQKISKKTDIYLVDTFGETKNFYNLSNIAFLGGSIVNHGGQNPLEAARLGNYIINGPNIGNFTEIYDYLKINKISYTTSKLLKMRDLVLSKINKKLPLSKRKKIFDNGNKILDNNIRIIEKYI